MPWRKRISADDYTDSDIGMFYVHCRENKNSGAFIQEVGDFVAHNQRDKGVAFDQSIYLYSQIAFFVTYQRDENKQLNVVGDCPWWLRSYFVRKLEQCELSKFTKAIASP